MNKPRENIDILSPEQEVVGSNPTGRTNFQALNAPPSAHTSTQPALSVDNPIHSAHQLPTTAGSPLKIYLAARYTRRLELCAYRAELEAMGHTVTSRWLNGSHQIDSKGNPLGDSGELAIESGDQCAAHFATEDVADVYAADLVIAFTEEPRSGHSRGGRHVELGLALAKQKQIAIVGPKENVFCWLPGILHFQRWQACLDSIWVIDRALRPPIDLRRNAGPYVMLECRICGLYIVLRDRARMILFESEENLKMHAACHVSRRVNPTPRRVGDPVNPNHYQGDYVMRIIEDFKLDFHRGTVLKYLLRAGNKPGDSAIQDLEKARWYLDRLIARLRESTDPQSSPAGLTDTSAGRTE